ncbi:DUF6792 domain-containing protein [Lacticigenium naphthae]|uniref:DUF6792 domain-containing protein n=1 Tax=Lacticigenium naphthae TaxID=515351 RepID=UPI0003FEE1C9|nr:DUF6792 domain-containing protein [Lacticigenium naphthae]
MTILEKRQIDTILSQLENIWLLVEEKDTLSFENEMKRYQLMKNKNTAGKELEKEWVKMQAAVDNLNYRVTGSLRKLVHYLEEEKLDSSFFEKENRMFPIYRKFSLVPKKWTLKRIPFTDRVNQARSFATLSFFKEENSAEYKKAILATMQKRNQYFTEHKKWFELKRWLIQIFQNSITRSQANLLNKTKKKSGVSDLIKERLLMQELLLFEYEKFFYTKTEQRAYIQWLIYRHTKEIWSTIEYIDARESLPSLQTSGFSGSALIVHSNEESEVLYNFKGSENSLKVLKNKLPTHFYQDFLLEAYKDWKYNVESVMIGVGTEQLDDAQKFIQVIDNKISTKRFAAYGIGHSLGGNLLQMIQLIDQPFKHIYSVNASPIQMKQVFQVAPDLFQKEEWEEIFTSPASWDSSTNMDLKRRLAKKEFHSFHDRFQQDFTGLFLFIHSTAFLGDTEQVTMPVFTFHFPKNMRLYISEKDMYVWYDTIYQVFASLDEQPSLGDFYHELTERLKHTLLTDHPSLNQQALFTLIRHFFDFVEAAQMIQTEDLQSVYRTLDTLEHTQWEEKNHEKDQTYRREVLLLFQQVFSLRHVIDTETIKLLSYFHRLDGFKELYKKMELKRNKKESKSN